MFTHTLMHTYIYTHRHTHTYTHARSHTHSGTRSHTPSRLWDVSPSCMLYQQALQHSHPKFPSAPLMKPQRAETALCDSKPLIPHRTAHDLSHVHVNVQKRACRNSPHLCIIITALDRGTYSRESSPM